MRLAETYFAVDHLWVVISLPGDDGSVVIVNFTSWRAGCDENCVIETGEHKFVTHKTVVAYEKARLVSAQNQAALAKISVGRWDPVSPALLARIQAGALSSDLTQQKLQKAVEASMAKQAKEPV